MKFEMSFSFVNKKKPKPKRLYATKNAFLVTPIQVMKDVCIIQYRTIN